MSRALNPTIRLSHDLTDRKIAVGLTTPQQLYQRKVVKRALRNLKIVQAKQHYNNVSYFSNAQRKQQELERERRLIEEKKQCERLAKRIMRQTGKTAESLLSCNTATVNQKNITKFKKGKKKKVRLLTDHSNAAVRAIKPNVAPTSGHYSNNNIHKAVKSNQRNEKEHLIRKTNFQDSANSVLRDQRPYVYHSKLGSKLPSTSRSGQMETPPLLANKNTNNLINGKMGPKLRGILKKTNKHFRFGY